MTAQFVISATPEFVTAVKEYARAENIKMSKLMRDAFYAYVETRAKTLTKNQTHPE